MSNEQLVTRILSAQSEIPHKNIQLGLLNQNQRSLLKLTADKLKKIKYIF